MTRFPQRWIIPTTSFKQEALGRKCRKPILSCSKHAALGFPNFSFPMIPFLLPSRQENDPLSKQILPLLIVRQIASEFISSSFLLLPAKTVPSLWLLFVRPWFDKIVSPFLWQHCERTGLHVKKDVCRWSQQDRTSKVAGMTWAEWWGEFRASEQAKVASVRLLTQDVLVKIRHTNKMENWREERDRDDSLVESASPFPIMKCSVWGQIWSDSGSHQTGLAHLQQESRGSAGVKGQPELFPWPQCGWGSGVHGKHFP